MVAKTGWPTETRVRNMSVRPRHHHGYVWPELWQRRNHDPVAVGPSAGNFEAVAPVPSRRDHYRMGAENACLKLGDIHDSPVLSQRGRRQHDGVFLGPDIATIG